MELLTLIAAWSGTQLIVGGAMGGVARWFFLQDKPQAGLAAVALGAIMGFYVSPYFAPVIGQALSAFAVDPDKLPGFAAFATGAGGIAILGIGFDWLNERRKLKAAGAVDPALPTKEGS